MAEECFRNIKTVVSLGAQDKFYSKYLTVAKNCFKRAIKGIHIASMWNALSLFCSHFAVSLMYLSAVLIVMNQRRDYPTELFDAGCTLDLTPAVDFCYAGMNMTMECQAICDAVDSCWFSRNGQCLVGGEVVVVMMAVLQAIQGIGGAFTSLVQLSKARMSAAFFLEVIDHKDEMVDTKAICPASNKGVIEFKDVSFKYKSRDTMILNHLNFTIRENEMIGIVGESGCGKSTILKLLMRLYAPCAGEIDWDGVNVRDLSTHWIREQISYVAQEPVLFSGTIRENLMYGREGATEAEMVEAAKLVEADKFIRQFPNGYDTYVGELGTSLSGGQKQRIAIARALLRYPRILVLDEATSALDTESEGIVQRAIETIREENKKRGSGLSIVVVAHRLSSIRVCDRIVVMEEGHVGEEGTHEELMAKGGLYAGLYQTQSMGVTPMEEASEEEEVKEEVICQSSRRKSSLIEMKYATNEKKDEDEIPDEISESEMKEYGIVTLMKRTHTKTFLFWMGFVGSLMCVTFSPLYSYATSVIQGILYDYGAFSYQL